MSHLKDMVSADYVAPEWGAEYLSNTGMPKDSKVLDCAAGTGLVAEVLRRKFGFVGEIDAIDGCAEMLEKAKEKKIFNKLVCCKMGEGNRLPFDDSKLANNSLSFTNLRLIYSMWIDIRGTILDE